MSCFFLDDCVHFITCPKVTEQLRKYQYLGPSVIPRVPLVAQPVSLHLLVKHQQTAEQRALPVAACILLEPVFSHTCMFACPRYREMVCALWRLPMPMDYQSTKFHILLQQWEISRSLRNGGSNPKCPVPIQGQDSFWLFKYTVHRK